MFGKRQRELEDRMNRLEAAMTNVAQAVAASAESARELKAMLERMPSASVSAHGVEGLVSPLVEGALRAIESQGRMLDKLMDRAGKKALSDPAAEMGRRGQAKMRANKAARDAASSEPALGQLPVFVATCEECQAVLHNRVAQHTNHLFTHNTEQHIAELQKLGVIRS